MKNTYSLDMGVETAIDVFEQLSGKWIVGIKELVDIEPLKLKASRNIKTFKVSMINARKSYGNLFVQSSAS